MDEVEKFALPKENTEHFLPCVRNENGKYKLIHHELFIL